MNTQYALYNSKNELIGTCEMDDPYDGGWGPFDTVFMCHDLKGQAYEIGAHSICKILNPQSDGMPKIYAKIVS